VLGFNTHQLQRSQSECDPHIHFGLSGAAAWRQLKATAAADVRIYPLHLFCRPSNRVRLHLNLGSGNSASSWEMEGNEQLVKSTVEALGAALDEVAHLPATAADSQQATAAAALATSSDKANPHGEEEEAEAADKQEAATGQQQPGAQEQHQEDQQDSAVEEAQQDAAEKAEQQQEEQQDGAKANKQEEEQRDGAEEAEQQGGTEEEQLVPTPAAPTAAEEQEEQQEEKEDAAGEQGGLFDGSASKDVSEARGLEFTRRFKDCDNSGQFSCLNRQNNWVRSATEVPMKWCMSNGGVVTVPAVFMHALSSHHRIDVCILLLFCFRNLARRGASGSSASLTSTLLAFRNVQPPPFSSE
jgi:hypothetical protein